VQSAGDAAAPILSAIIIIAESTQYAGRRPIGASSSPSPFCWPSNGRASTTANIQPRRADQKGKVERSHRIDAEEFWGRHTFESFEAAAAALPEWECVFNDVPFSMALQGRTPAEKLAAVLAAA